MNLYKNIKKGLKESENSAKEIIDWFHKEYPNSVINGDVDDNKTDAELKAIYGAWKSGTLGDSDGEFVDNTNIDSLKQYLSEVFNDKNASIWVVPYPYEFNDIVEYNGNKYKFGFYEHSDGKKSQLYTLKGEEYSDEKYGNYIPTDLLKRASAVKESALKEGSGDRYQLRKYDGVVAPYGIYDTQDKKFVGKGEKGKYKNGAYEKSALELELDKRNNKYHEDKAKDINWKEEEKKLLSDITSVKTEALEHFYKVFKEQGKNKFAERVKAVLDKRKGLAESADYPDESDIDHFIERGASLIPVRKGQTDEEVLRHLDRIGILGELEPTEEEKASGKYVQEQVYSTATGAGGLCEFKWRRNPDYVEPIDKLEESDEGNSNADRIVEEFTKSKRLRDTYYKALTLISQLENDNHIDREKYDECIKKLQDLYNKRDRSIKEAVELSYDDYYAFGTEDSEDAVFCDECGQPVSPDFCYIEDESDPNSAVYCWPCHDRLVANGSIQDNE